MSGAALTGQLFVEGPVGKLSVTVTDGDAALAPVCFIHPVNTSGAVWTDVVARLRPARRCALPDLRGHGRSVLAGPFTVDAYAADVVAVLDELGWDQAHLVGASLGGPIAVALAATLPDRVLSVAGFGTALALHLDDASLAHVRRLLDTKGVRGLFELLAPAAIGAVRRDELGPLAVELTAGGDRPPDLVFDVIAAAFSSDVSHLADRVRVPVLVGNGDEDGSCSPAAAQAMGQACSTATVTTFSGVGHLPMIEIPDQLAALLDQHFTT